MLTAVGLSANAQFFEFMLGLVSGAEEVEEKQRATMVKYYNRQDQMTEVSVYDLKNTWRQQRGISALGDANTNWRAVREFLYNGKGAVVVFRKGQQKADDEIGVVEAAFEADDDFRDLHTLASVQYYDPTHKEDDMFATFRMKKYVAGKPSSHYLAREFLVEDEVSFFMLDFINSKLPFHDKSPMRYQNVFQKEIPAPYTEPAE